MSVTDGDRAKARELLHRLVAGSRQGVACSCGWFGPGSDHETHAVDAIAAALAAEREKARAPFRALADELEQSELPLTWLVLRRRPRPEAWILAVRVAERIRRAAEDS